jgi:transcriptional regulator with XRE-family HTH domain
VILGASTSRAARGLLDWTQLQLADAAQVGIGMLRNFEAGRCVPGEANLFAIQSALEAAGVQFLPDGGVRLCPDQVTFDAEYVVDRYKVRLTARRNERAVIVDVPRETIDDAAEVTADSTVQRVANFKKFRLDFEACAKDVLRSQTPHVRRINLDTTTFDEWRKRHRQLVGSGETSHF